MTDVSAGFRPPCWCPSRWAPAWRLHTNLYKFGKNVSPHIFRKKNCCDLNLGESLCIYTFFLFPDSRLNRWNGFYFLFWSILNGVTLKTNNIQWVADVDGISKKRLWIKCAFAPIFQYRVPRKIKGFETIFRLILSADKNWFPTKTIQKLSISEVKMLLLSVLCSLRLLQR